MESLPHSGTIAAPPLPEPGPDLYVIHYSQRKAADCTAATPSVSAIVVQHFLSGHQRTFSALHHAEREGIAAADLKGHELGLEKSLLQDFTVFLAENPDANWLHWAMRTPRFGFEVIDQRARRHGLEPPAIPMGRRHDLAHYLKRTYGPEFAPHPRLWYACRQNGFGGAGLLDERQSAEAWAAGDYAALLWSLTEKVHAIAFLYERARSRRFQTCGFRPPSDAEIVDQLRKSGSKGKPLCAALVEFMSGRTSANLCDIASVVHGDDTTDSRAIRANVRRTNTELEAFSADFRFKVAASHLHKLPAGATRSAPADSDAPVRDL